MDPGDDPCIAGQLLPGGDRNGPAVESEDGPRGQHRHDGRSGEVLVGECEQRQQGAPGEGPAQPPACHAVERQVGTGEALVEQPGVAVASRVGDRHAVERDAGPGPGEHLADRQPRLFVGIGDRADQQPRPGRNRSRRIRGEHAAEPFDQAAYRGIGVGIAGVGDDDGDRPAGGQRLDECEARRGEPVGEVEHECAEPVEQRVPGGDGGCGGQVQVDLVDVAVGQAVVDLAVEAHHLGGPLARVDQFGEGVVVEFTQFAVDPDQCPFGGRMAGDGSQEVGRRLEDGPHGGANDRIGDPPPSVGKRGPGQQAGQAQDGLEADGGQPGG